MGDFGGVNGGGCAVRAKLDLDGARGGAEEELNVSNGSRTE